MARKAFLYSHFMEGHGKSAPISRLPLITILDAKHHLKYLPVCQPFHLELNFFSKENLNVEFFCSCWNQSTANHSKFRFQYEPLERFVEPLRAAPVNHGKGYGEVVVIVDVSDQNRDFVFISRLHLLVPECNGAVWYLVIMDCRLVAMVPFVDYVSPNLESHVVDVKSQKFRFLEYKLWLLCASFALCFFGGACR